MNRTFKILLVCAVALIAAVLFAARLPSVLDILDDQPELAAIPLVLIAVGFLFLLGRARRTGEMPKGILSQFLYASTFGLFKRQKRNDKTGDS